MGLEIRDRPLKAGLTSAQEQNVITPKVVCVMSHPLHIHACIASSSPAASTIAVLPNHTTSDAVAVTLQASGAEGVDQPQPNPSINSKALKI